MTKKLYDLAVPVRRYKDSFGNEKAVWQKVGVQLVSDGGQPYILFEPWFNPAGIERKNDSGKLLISLFPPKDKNSNNSDPRDNSSPQEYDPDIPF